MDLVAVNIHEQISRQISRKILLFPSEFRSREIRQFRVNLDPGIHGQKQMKNLRPGTGLAKIWDRFRGPRGL